MYRADATHLMIPRFLCVYPFSSPTRIFLAGGALYVLVHCHSVRSHVYSLFLTLHDILWALVPQQVASAGVVMLHHMNDLVLT